MSNLLILFEQQKQKSLAPGYRAVFSYAVRIARDYFKNQDVRDLRKLDLISYKEHLEQKYAWKAKTLKNVLDVFKSFMRYVRNDLELITSVPSFPLVEVPETPFRWVGQKDQAELFEKVPDEHKPIIAFLVLHGCRPGRAPALKCQRLSQPLSIGVSL